MAKVTILFIVISYAVDIKRVSKDKTVKLIITALIRVVPGEFEVMIDR